MTVITASSVSEKKLQKEPLVEAADGADGGQESSPRTRTLVRVVRQRLQPVSEHGPLVSACVFVSAVLLFCAGMAACAYLYQQYQGYQVWDLLSRTALINKHLISHDNDSSNSAISADGVAFHWHRNSPKHQEPSHGSRCRHYWTRLRTQ